MAEFAIVDQLTAPDVLLPEQYYGYLRGGNAARYTGERRLMLAMLENALEEYTKYADARKPAYIRLYRDAADWIFDEHHDHPCDFINICESLGLEPEYIREGLRDAEADGRSITMRNRQVIGGTQQRVTPLRMRVAAANQVTSGG